MLSAAESVRRSREISPYVAAGGVAAAVLSDSGIIYTGVCVDTSCTLGICAERNAIFNMITCGEQKIARVLAIGDNGKVMPPCGACRELMMQLMPFAYKEIAVLIDKETMLVAHLGECMPHWWQ